MNVRECIDNYRSKTKHSNRRITKVWVCPDAVIRPKIGVEYTLTFDIRTAVKEPLADAAVIRQWAEGDTFCVIFQNTLELQNELFSS